MSTLLEEPATRSETSPAQQLRTTMAAVRLSISQPGTRKTLSDQQKAIMDLVDLQGIAPTDASVLLGLNPSTGRVHLLRARRRIRARILEARPSIVEDLTS